MKIEELPELRRCALTANVDVIADALYGATLGKKFTHITVVRGASRSVRALLTEKDLDAVSLPRPFTSIEMAEELVRLGREEARYDPPANKVHDAVKGWDISLAFVNGNRVVIASASWID